MAGGTQRGRARGRRGAGAEVGAGRGRGRGRHGARAGVGAGGGRGRDGPHAGVGTASKPRQAKRCRTGGGDSREGATDEGRGESCKGPEQQRPLATPEQRALLECPICMEMMFPPISQCTNGHVFCSQCKLRLEGECPTCRVSLQSVGRVLHLEKLAETLLWPCKLQPKGCHQAHEARCGTYSCPGGINCDFAGDIPGIIAHLKDKHQAVMRDNGIDDYHGLEADFVEGPSKLLRGNRDPSPWVPELYSCCGEHFYIIADCFRHGGYKTIDVSVLFLGEEEDAERFMCKLEVTGGGGKLSCEATPTSIRAPAPGALLVIPRNHSAVKVLSEREGDDFMFYLRIQIEKNGGS